MEKKKVRLSEMLPAMEETLSAGGTVKLPITGTSMLPPLRRFDLPLYRRKDGAFVLHRVVAVEKDGTYTMCGDNQWVKEPGISGEQIIGVVTEVERKGKLISVQSFRYRAYVRVWHALFPVRKYLVKLRGKLTK